MPSPLPRPEPEPDTAAGRGLRARVAAATASGITASVLSAGSVCVDALERANHRIPYADGWLPWASPIATLGIVAGTNVTHVGVLVELGRDRARLRRVGLGPLDDAALGAEVLRRAALAASVPVVLENTALAGMFVAALLGSAERAVIGASATSLYVLAVILMALTRRAHPSVNDGAQWLRERRVFGYRAEHVIDVCDDLAPGIRESNGSAEPGHVGLFGRRTVYAVLAYGVVLVVTGAQQPTPAHDGQLRASSAQEQALTTLLVPDVAGTPAPGETYTHFCKIREYPWVTQPEPVRSRLGALLVEPGEQGRPGGAGAGAAGCATEPPVTLRADGGSVTFQVSRLDGVVRSVALVTPDGDSLLFNGAARYVLSLLQAGRYVSASPRQNVGSGDLYVLQVAGRGSVVLVRDRKNDQARPGYAEPYAALGCSQAAAWVQLMAQRQSWLWPQPDTARTKTGVALRPALGRGIVATLDEARGGTTTLMAGGVAATVACAPVTADDVTAWAPG